MQLILPEMTMLPTPGSDAGDCAVLLVGDESEDELHAVSAMASRGQTMPPMIILESHREFTRCKPELPPRSGTPSALEGRFTERSAESV